MTRAFFSFPTLLWITAFICALYFVNSWELELYTSAVVCSFLGAMIMFCRGAQDGWQIPQSWVCRFVALFWFLTFVSIFNSETTYISLMAFCFFSVLPLSFFMFAFYPDHNRFKIIGYLLALIFLILSVWAIIQYFFYNEAFNGHAHHPLANPNSLGALFNLALFSSVGWLLVSKGQKTKIVATILSVVIIGGLMSTSSRGAFFSLIIFMPFMLFFLRSFLKDNFVYLLAIFFGFLAFFLLTSLGVQTNNQMVYRITETVMLADEDVSNNRFNIWEGAIAILKDNWLLGTGIGTFFIYYQGYRSPNELHGAYHAHSDPLQFWVELGVLGPVLFYGVLIAVFLRTIKAFKSTAIDDVNRLSIMVPFFALSAIVLHAHVTFNFYNLSILMGCGFLLAIWFNATSQVLNQQYKHVVILPNIPKSVRQFMVVLPVLLLGLTFLPYMASERIVNQSRHKLLKADIEAFFHDIRLANALSKNNNFRTFTLAANVPITMLQEALPTLHQEQKKHMVDQAYVFLMRALELNPRSSSAYFYLGRLKQLAPLDLVPEDLLEAEEYYQKALNHDVTHLSARMELADIYINRGEKEKGYTLLDDGFDLRYRKANVIEYYNLMAMVYLDMGETEKKAIALERLHSARQRFNLR